MSTPSGGPEKMADYKLSPSTKVLKLHNLIADYSAQVLVAGQALPGV
jgi:hypothetical protein